MAKKIALAKVTFIKKRELTNCLNKVVSAKLSLFKREKLPILS